MKGQSARLVYSAFQKILSISPEQIDQIGVSLAIPTFQESLLVSLCDEAMNVFRRQNHVIQLSSPMYVVGDIHGNIFDLIRCLIYAKPPPASRILFLGDYVDRGEYSVECIALLFSLIVLYPENVFLLRGNHEFEEMNSTYGFLTEILNQYPSRVFYESSNDAFSYMPFIAIINNNIFCVHGGISPTLERLEDLESIHFPLREYEVDYISDLVWSDPNTKIKNFENSKRGLGVQFGPAALEKFLETHHAKTMIRAHQCVDSGVSKFNGNMLYTVFSCSNYSDENRKNRCGLIFVQENDSLQLFSLPPLTQISRKTVKLEAFEGTKATFETKQSLAINLKLQDLENSSRKRFHMNMSMKSSAPNLLTKFREEMSSSSSNSKQNSDADEFEDL